VWIPANVMYIQHFNEIMESDWVEDCTTTHASLRYVLACLVVIPVAFYLG
jgi:hypothetical protein